MTKNSAKILEAVSYQNYEIDDLIKNSGSVGDALSLPTELSSPIHKEALGAVVNNFQDASVKETTMVLPIRLYNDHVTLLVLQKDQDQKVRATYIDPIGLETPHNALEPMDQETILKYSSIPSHIQNILSDTKIDLEITTNRLQFTAFEHQDGDLNKPQIRHFYHDDGAAISTHIAREILDGNIKISSVGPEFKGWSQLKKRDQEGNFKSLADNSEEEAEKFGREIIQNHSQELLPKNAAKDKMDDARVAEKSENWEIETTSSESSEESQSSRFGFPSLGSILTKIIPFAVLGSAFANKTNNGNSTVFSGNYEKRNLRILSIINADPTGQPTVPPTPKPTTPTSQPSSQPSGQPSRQPSSQPSGQPSRQPSRQPTRQPTAQPSIPTGQPSSEPSSQPSRQPSSQPSRQPSSQPSSQPSGKPSALPTAQPSIPTGQPSSQPSRQPSSQPSRQPTSQPSSQPSGDPCKDAYERFKKNNAEEHDRFLKYILKIAGISFGAGMVAEAAMLFGTKEQSITGSLYLLCDEDPKKMAGLIVGTAGVITAFAAIGGAIIDSSRHESGTNCDYPTHEFNPNLNTETLSLETATALIGATLGVLAMAAIANKCCRTGPSTSPRNRGNNQKVGVSRSGYEMTTL